MTERIVRVYDCEQYSEEWWALRAGRFTASQAAKLLTPTGKVSTQYKAELGRLIAERMGLQEPERNDFSTEWMDRGSELEDEAFAWFCVDQDVDLQRVGFISDGSEVVGASPDAVFEDFLFTNRGGVDQYQTVPVEIKCPKPSTHIQWLMDGGVPKAHLAQVHFQMALLGANQGFFMSYHPDLEPLVVPLVADKYTQAMEKAIDQFKSEYEDAYRRFSNAEG